MPKRLHVTPLLSVDELERRYRAADDPVLRSHYQMIWLLARGWSTTDVIAATGYSRTWIQTIARRYNQAGPAGLGDRRHANPGSPPLLDAAGHAALKVALGEVAPDGGLWTGPKVARWIGQRLGRSVADRRGWEYLRRLGYTPHRPRPAHTQADPDEQAAFPKCCASR